VPQAGENVQLETMYSERDGRVATIVLNRPHVLNCANEQWARDLNLSANQRFLQGADRTVAPGAAARRQAR
jgi:hypothetical protein